MSEKQMPDNVEQSAMSPLDAPDEEIMNMDFSALDAPDESVEESMEETTEESEVVDDESATEELEDVDESSDSDTDEEADEADEESTDDGEEVESTEEEAADESSEEEESDVSDNDDSEDEKLDYEAEYKRVLAPLKANGKELQIDSVDDLRRLAQMGANYNKKMTALKPNLKVLKLLENNQLLDEGKLSFLIDLDKKNPEAITKLLKDGDIDPLDLDTKKESDYKPNNYTVDDRQLELEEVLDEIKDTPDYNKTVELVSTKWDAPSKQIVAENPQLLAVINNHMASGVYEQVSNEVDRERTFGRLKGLNDLEAYRQIGEAMQKNGKFAHLNQPAQQQEKPPAKRVVAKSKKASPELKSKKRAASSVKTSNKSSTPAPENPLDMPDEEFENLMPQYL